MDKIFIKNLKTTGILGIHPHEQTAPREIRISLELSTDITRAAKDDEILETINYATLAKKITEFTRTHSFLTIEALIEALAGEILTDPMVQTVWLRVEKPGAVPEADAVGVEIARRRMD